MTPEQEPLSLLQSGAHVHLVGVAGAGMSALAAVLLARGFRLSGSDQQRTPQISRLIEAGLVFYGGHDAAQVDGADLVIISAAVLENNVEVAAARRAGTEVVKRAAALGWLLKDKQTIAVAGTHGKTTTSAMLAVILTHAGLDPTFVVGGDVLDLGASARFGSGEWAVVEADEYDRSFLQLEPTVALITNIEPDHLEYFGTIEAMHQAFRRFAELIKHGGSLVINADNPHLAELSDSPGVEVVRCALADVMAAWQARDIVEGATGSHFRCIGPGIALEIDLAVSGRHNVSNALQAVAAAVSAGVDASTAAAALTSFHGAGRRFEMVGEAAGVLVIDDYAHHPTEIRATLAAARSRFGSRRLVAVFQPHTYSRTKLLFDDFVGAFDAADLVLVTEIYPARETDSLGMTSMQLVHALAGRLGSARLLPVIDADAVPTVLTPYLRAGDIVITLGAGTITNAGPLLLAALSQATMSKT